MRAYDDEVALIEAVAACLVEACPADIEVRRGEGGTNALDAHYVISIVPARTDASKLCLFAYAADGVELAVGRAGSFMFDFGAAAALDDELLELGFAVIDGGLRETTVEDQDGVLESCAEITLADRVATARHFFGDRKPRPPLCRAQVRYPRFARSDEG